MKTLLCLVVLMGILVGPAAAGPICSSNACPEFTQSETKVVYVVVCSSNACPEYTNPKTAPEPSLALYNESYDGQFNYSKPAVPNNYVARVYRDRN